MFKATVVARRFAWTRRRVKGQGWTPVRRVSHDLGPGFGKHYVEHNPAFLKLLAKCQKAVADDGATLTVTFRKPTDDDRGHYRVEMADIELTFPD